MQTRQADRDLIKGSGKRSHELNVKILPDKEERFRTDQRDRRVVESVPGASHTRESIVMPRIHGPSLMHQHGMQRILQETEPLQTRAAHTARNRTITNTPTRTATMALPPCTNAACSSCSRQSSHSPLLREGALCICQKVSTSIMKLRVRP